MAITSLSPGINITEIDLTTIVPATATSTGAFAGPFVWGPGEEITTVSSELKLVEYFGKPNDDIAPHWYSAANFLAYSGNLKVVRSLASNTYNAVEVGASDLQIKNQTDYEENYADGATTTYGTFCAKYPGKIGNTLKISICPNSNSYYQNVSSQLAIFTNNAVTSTNTTVNTTSSMINYVAEGDLIQISDGTYTSGYLEVANVTSGTITFTSNIPNPIATNAVIEKRWRYFSSFTDAPTTSDFVATRDGSNDEMHIVVVDTKGLFTGTKNAVLERFGFVSKASDAKTPEGSSNYYKNVINSRSQYLYWLTQPAYGTNWGGVSLDTVFEETVDKAQYNTLSGGEDGVLSTGDLQISYDLFANAETSDVSLIISGPASTDLKNYIIAMIESRRDCMAFFSPLRSDCVDNVGQELNDIINTRRLLMSSFFAVHDSGWKYQYDKYNDEYRWVPLNGDIAGLTARTDETYDPWFSPAGSNRGIIKNVVKLAWNPDKTDRDELYQLGINSVVTFTGEGTLLFGDKTLTTRPSAFDKINVRRLFIVLEKSISKASRSTLFEFNDQFTRAQFVSIVEPYLRDVKGRRGIIDFKVVCDETNNTGEVIDRGEFIGDIYIKPARSINFIQLNFVAVRTGVNFSEVVGSFN